MHTPSRKHRIHVLKKPLIFEQGVHGGVATPAFDRSLVEVQTRAGKAPPFLENGHEASETVDQLLDIAAHQFRWPTPSPRMHRGDENGSVPGLSNCWLAESRYRIDQFAVGARITSDEPFGSELP